ncbi:IMPACT-like protein [Elsinoe australis]|uniref:IMPACT-like protein n=1 Tax=Elsinoe australis TaxID=40998 RepID=A0A4U7AP41_9PEZI|nr:IMPACT-like protein [Elsinoe australis]
MSEQLEDEITSINAIYTDDSFTFISTKPTTCSLLLPGEHQISLRLEFPSDYPDVPPSILGTQSVGDHVPKGIGQTVVELARQVLSEVYIPGSPCIYDLIEDLSSRLEQLLSASIESQADATRGPEQAQGFDGQDHPAHSVAESNAAQSSSLLGDPPPWVLSDVVSEKKSVFVARAAHVTSTDQAKSFVQHLLATDKKAARATHNMTAWRIRGPNQTAFQDCDDDGEDAAGGRMLHLLQLMDVWDVMVVVTRWYGGIHLGPDRFRIINSVARDAIVKGGFVNEAPKGKGEGKKGKK